MRELLTRIKFPAIALIVLVALWGGSAVFRWYTSDAMREQRLHDELSALPGVAEVEISALEQEIHLADGITVDQARSAYAAVGEGRWTLVLGPAETDVYGSDDKTDTRGVDVLVMVGNAGLVDDNPGGGLPGLRVLWDPREHGVTIHMFSHTDVLGWTTALVDSFAAHRGLLPSGTTITGGWFGPLASEAALADLDGAQRELAALSELADLEPRFSLDGARPRVEIHTPSRDGLDAVWKRVRAARSHAPHGLDVTVILDGHRVDDPRTA